ncbi:MAG: hypothetical protein EON59_05970 [Alphaproteobacteria bacterium]|nr:MAG: hypothetical protein EON59_05970 [Alphaproteobacteria bacterium]
MEALAPAYLPALAVQIGALSAVLGGFATAFLGVLLTLAGHDRLGTIGIGGAVISAVAFIVAVVASTLLVATLHPDAPTIATQVSANTGRALMVLSFFLGLYAL